MYVWSTFGVWIGLTSRSLEVSWPGPWHTWTAAPGRQVPFVRFNSFSFAERSNALWRKSFPFSWMTVPVFETSTRGLSNESELREPTGTGCKPWGLPVSLWLFRSHMGPTVWGNSLRSDSKPGSLTEDWGVGGSGSGRTESFSADFLRLGRNRSPVSE